jgi:DNA-binding transcriptional LysR family regulator
MADSLRLAHFHVQQQCLDETVKFSFTMLDVRRLLLLRELAARGTVTAVAGALAYTPSAVSQQLAALERDAGVPLLERIGRRLQLTDAGRRLVEHADVVLAQLEEAEADLAATTDEVGGRIRIAAFQTAAHALVLPALGVLGDRHPALRCELLQAEAEDALPGVRLGDVDLVVAEEYNHAPRPRDAALDYRSVCRDLLVVSVPDGHPAAGLDAIPLSALEGEQWAGGEMDTAWNDMITRVCRSIGGYEPDIRHHVDDVQLILGLVAAQRVVALVPSLGRPYEFPGVVTRPAADGPFERLIFTAVRRGTRDAPATRAVHDALAEQARALGL